MSFRSTGLWLPIFPLLAALASGCDGPEDEVRSVRAPAGAHALGESCESDDPARLCVALRYVVYEDGDATVVDEADALGNLDAINAVWGQCGVRFEIEEFFGAAPAAWGLRARPAEYDELSDIRRAFATASHFLVVTTSEWDRGGTLGATAANAWTTLPGGDGPFGAVLEASVGRYSPIISHELGHYLGLSHVSDVNDVMNGVVYRSSSRVSAEQCAQARATVAAYWRSALR